MASHDGLEVLSRAECLGLLRRAHLGRVAFTTNGVPDIFPVTFTLVGEDVVFRTGRGAKFDAAINQRVVAFEADDVVGGDRGWSVVVAGPADHVTDPDVVAELKALAVPPIAAGDRPYFVRIPTETISGRRIPHPRSDWLDLRESALATVLVVDDDPLVRQGVIRMLEGEPFLVIGEGEHGAHALRLTDELHPDVVILDYEMPGLDGLETAARLFQRRPGLLIVLCSTATHPALPRVATKLGISAYVHKTNLAVLPEVLRGLTGDDEHDPGGSMEPAESDSHAWSDTS